MIDFKDFLHFKFCFYKFSCRPLPDSASFLFLKPTNSSRLNIQFISYTVSYANFHTCSGHWTSTWPSKPGGAARRCSRGRGGCRTCHIAFTRRPSKCRIIIPTFLFTDESLAITSPPFPLDFISSESPALLQNVPPP